MIRLERSDRESRELTEEELALASGGAEPKNNAKLPLLRPEPVRAEPVHN